MSERVRTASDVPEGWVTTTLGAVASPSRQKVEPAEHSSARYLSLEHIEAETSRILGSGTGSDVTSTKAVFRAGDVLYGKLRPYLNKVCIPNFDGICSTDILVFAQSGQLEPHYLLRFLMQQSVVEYAHHRSAGVQLPRVSIDVLAALEFPLPPLAEQKRIVAKVEELLARVNAARARLAKAPALLKRFRQSVLAAACSGQLTADWREERTDVCAASELIARIRASRPAGGALSPSVEAGEDLPARWALTTIGFLAEPTLRGKPFITSGSRGWAEYVSPIGPYFIRSENINTEYLELADAVRVSPPPGAEADRTVVQPGDLLLTITGNNVGRTAVVPPNCPRAHVSQHVAIIRLSPLCSSQFVWLWVRSIEHGQRQLQAFFYGYTKPGLNLEQVRSVAVALPPVEEQREIVRRVEALFAVADKIEARAKAATARVEKLTQAILVKAFRGELVATEAELARQEGRAYEPASALLARIRATSADAATSPNGRARRRAANAAITPASTERRAGSKTRARPKRHV